MFGGVYHLFSKVFGNMKMNNIFGFPTIEKPRIDIKHDFWWHTPSSPPTPPHKGDLAGVGVTLK